MLKNVLECSWIIAGRKQVEEWETDHNLIEVEEINVLLNGVVDLINGYGDAITQQMKLQLSDSLGIRMVTSRRLILSLSNWVTTSCEEMYCMIFPYFLILFQPKISNSSFTPYYFSVLCWRLCSASSYSNSSTTRRLVSASNFRSKRIGCLYSQWSNSSHLQHQTSPSKKTELVCPSDFLEGCSASFYQFQPKPSISSFRGWNSELFHHIALQYQSSWCICRY